LIIGSSVYAFSTTLTVFLAGIALGSFIAIPLIRKMSSRALLRFVALLQLFLALSALLSMILIGQLPFLFMQVHAVGWRSSFAQDEFLHFALSFLVMILPTLAMGILFPVITSLWTRSREQLGQGVGVAYAANTLGTILGALLGGIVILPWLGIQNSVILASGLGILISVTYWLIASRQQPRPVRAGGALLAILSFGLIVWAMPPWRPMRMQSGPFLYANLLTKSFLAGTPERQLSSGNRLLYYEEGMNGVVSVNQADSDLYLVINGKVDATSKGDMPTQIMIGQLPMLIHPDPQQVLVLGMGSGSSAGAVTTHDALEQLDLVEISPQVVEAAKFFKNWNEDLHDNPKVNLIEADGRNYVAATDKKYDVIISEPSNPWISGVSNLFTREFFQSARQRLKPGGIVTQWFHTYSMSEQDLQSLLATFAAEFAYVSIWSPLSSDLILIGSDQPINLDDQQMRSRFNQPAVRSNIRYAGKNKLAEVMNDYVLDDQRIRNLAANGRINSDDHPYIEFNAPRFLLSNTHSKNLKFLYDNQTVHNIRVPVNNLAVADDDGWEIAAANLHLQPQSSQSTRPQGTWLIQHRRSDDEENVFVKNNVMLEWQDAVSRYQLLSGVRTESDKDIQTRDLLDSHLRDGIIQRGSMKLENQVDAYWAFGPQKASATTQIVLAWEYKVSEKWGYQYVARSILAESSDANLRSKLVEFAKQFSCLAVQ